MRILVVTQYFWPESFRVNDFILGLKEQGHEVIVFTGKPNYPSGSFFEGYSLFGRSKEIWNSIPVYRSGLIPRGNGKGFRLILNYFSFAFLGCWKAIFLSIQADVVIAYQQSPVTAALPAIVFKRKNKARMFLYIQDLWPESVIATTHIKNSFVVKMLGKLTDYIYANSDSILVQSKAFIDFLTARKVGRSKIFYLPNSTDKFYRKVNKNTAYAKYFSGEMNIVFAGNIGEAQSFETLVSAAKLVRQKDKGIVWIIIGEGRKKAEIQKLVEEEGIEDVFKFIGSFDQEKMPFFFANADVLLISLKKDFIFSLTIPTKLQSYLACAKPVIGSLDGEGRLIIDNANCGLTSPAEDPDGLAQNILKFRNMAVSEREQLAANALDYFEKEFKRDTLLNRLDEILCT